MGSRFTVVTEHKPLVSNNNPQSNPPARIERWTLSSEDRHDGGLVEEYVNFVTVIALPKAITFEEVQEETLKDEVLQQVPSAIERNKLDHLLDKKSPDNNGRLVMPFTLQTRVIDLAHEGHQGLVKSKQLMRTKVWFPGIDK